MRRLAFLVLLAACSNPTGNGTDPVVGIENTTDWTVRFQWRDGQGILGQGSIIAHSTSCERFNARADSAYFTISVTNPNVGGTPLTTTYTQPWFDPATRHAWAALIGPGGGGSPNVTVRDTTDAPC